MTSPSVRRPVPALIALAALLLLTALVWWRVLHRGTGSPAATPCPTPTTPSGTVLPAPDHVTVTVLNSTDRNGIAGKARNALIDDGFGSSGPAGNDTRKRPIRGVAEIRYGPKGRDGARLLRYYLPGARLVATHSKSAVVVLSLGEKYRHVASASQVQAMLRRDDVRLATPSPTSPSPTASC